MDFVFVDTQQEASSAALQTHYRHQHSLLATLQEAAQRASFSGREVLVSFTQPIASLDPISVLNAFSMLQIGDCFFWEQPPEQKAFVGVGAATTIIADGPQRFNVAAARWQALQQDAVIAQVPEMKTASTTGPILFGGFAFDPQRPKTPLWSGFPDALLVLPRLLFTLHNDTAVLTISTMITPTTHIELLAEEIQQHLDRFAEHTSPSTIDDVPSEQNQLLIEDLTPAAEWKQLVANAVSMIHHNDYQKVVLARSVQVTNEQRPFRLEETLQRLRQSYPGAYIFALQRGERIFVGATPERLLQAQDGQVQAMALAGSAPRGTTPEEDQQLGAELLRSEKNKEEHAIVAATVRAALARICSEVWIADTPQLLRLKNIQHLETPIVGNLRPEHSILEAIQDLHPTPAVGGFPREAALKVIREYEGMDRGWYTGPIGWLDMHGNGEFAVALRSGLLYGHTATLFAGCGVVADSLPDSEYAESCLKFKVMVRGLGGEE